MVASPACQEGGIVASMSERFYVNCPLQPGLVVLEGAEAHHLANVCRFRPGDQVCLFNGDGHEYPATITQTTRPQAQVGVPAFAGRRRLKPALQLEVLEKVSPDRELGFRLEIAVPLPKGDRTQFLVEKLTEIGATSLVPLRTRRSVVHPGDNRLEKLQRYVVEACKQCGRNVLMEIKPLADWAVYCRQGTLFKRRILAHSTGGSFPQQEKEDKVLAVGPEGGFLPEEVDLARDNGWDLVSLGPRVLRVETAALVLAAWSMR